MKTGGQCCCRFQAKWLQLRVRVTRRYQMPGTSSTLAAFVKNRATMRHPQNLGRCFNFGWVPVFCCLLHRRIAQEQSSCSYTGIELKLLCDVLHIASHPPIELKWAECLKDISIIKSPYISDSWRGQTMNGGALWFWFWHYTQSNAENVPGVGCKIGTSETVLGAKAASQACISTVHPVRSQNPWCVSKSLDLDPNTPSHSVSPRIIWYKFAIKSVFIVILCV